MTPELIAALEAGTATNEMIAESRGWVKQTPSGMWTNGYTAPSGKWHEFPPDFNGDIRLTIADIKAKGWQWTLEHGGAGVRYPTATDVAEFQGCHTDTTAALNIAFAKAQLAEQENGHD
jgi:hypothetical protein